MTITFLNVNKVGNGVVEYSATSHTKRHNPSFLSPFPPPLATRSFVFDFSFRSFAHKVLLWRRQTVVHHTPLRWQMSCSSVKEKRARREMETPSPLWDSSMSEKEKLVEEANKVFRDDDLYPQILKLVTSILITDR